MDYRDSIPRARQRVLRVARGIPPAARRALRSVPRVPPGVAAGVVACSFAAALVVAGTPGVPAARPGPGAARQSALQFLVPDTAVAAPVRRDGYSVTARQPLVRWPVSDVTSVRDGFGLRVAPCAGCSSMHAGVDFDAPDGALVLAIADGTVLANRPNHSALGTHVSIRHLIDGRMVVSVYGHLRAGSTRFRPGDTVGIGDQIGLVGNTGRSTGPHLHFEIRLDGVTAIDPLAWLLAEAG